MKTSVWRTLAVILAVLALMMTAAVAALFGVYLTKGILHDAVIPIGWSALALGVGGLGVAIAGLVRERMG